MFLEYGVNEHGEMIHITQVNSGRSSLSCPYCGVGLIARKGQIKEHHFAHDGDTCRDVAERDNSAFVVPYYDHFNLGLSAQDIYDLHCVADENECSRTSTYALKQLEQRGYTHYNTFAYTSTWELTHRGKIPLGLATLDRFAAIQYEQMIAKHDEFSHTVKNAWKPGYRVGLTNTEPSQQTIQTALIDLNIYRAQLRRMFSASLYFIEIQHASGVLYKVGVSSRDIDERMKEVKQDISKHLLKPKIKVLRTLVNRGSVEFYFKFRYKDNQHKLGTLTEYFLFDDRRNVLSDLTRLGDFDIESHEFISGIVSGTPSEIELEIGAHQLEQEQQAIATRKAEQHRQATIAGMTRAKRDGVHVGRPKGTTEDDNALLEKYPHVIACLNDGLSLRKTATACNVSINTVRKVKALL